MPEPPFPAQHQLILPLLAVLDEAGGAASPAAAAQALADKIALPAEHRERRATEGTAAGVNAWRRHVRWVRQKAVLQGLVANGDDHTWAVTDTGKNALQTARPGVVVTVYETEHGVALWAECESAVRYVEDGLVNLILTSPPYPLLRQKAYGNLGAEDYLEWLLACAASWQPKLADDGSLVLNLGDVWQPGQPTVAPYQEAVVLGLIQRGYVLAQRFAWENPAKMPAPAEWVTVRRVRVTPSLEQVYWFAKQPHPKADNRRVLRRYSESMRQRLAAGGDAAQRRPSGHDRREGAFGADHGGSIPHNLITAANTSSNDRYLRACRAAGLPVHPARFPAALPDFFVRFLTNEGDVVWDPFGGSGTTAEVCERLHRHWIVTEQSLAYLRGGAVRVADAPGFRPYVDGPAGGRA
jgi:site-specific DNA-methyltransferase (cytosine-N4-specific)